MTMADGQLCKTWSLCVCGDLDNLLVVLIGEAKTVAELKAAIEHKSHVPVDEQSLYFQEQLLQDDCALKSISGLCDGGMVYLSRRPFTLVVISWLGKSPENVQIQLSHQIKDHPSSSLKSIICGRFGVKQADVIFICEGEILGDEHTNLRWITNGTRIVLQKVPLTVNVAEQDVNLKVSMPQGTTATFLKQQLCARNGLTQPQIQCGVYRCCYSGERKYKIPDVGPVSVEMCQVQKIGWTLNVQRVDNGTEAVPILVPSASESLPIVKLRECVEKCTSVPTHQQRLTIGSTIVEDWDDEDRMMFIGDYPNIHDGSLLYVEQLEEGSRMTVKHKESKSLKLVKKGLTEFSYKTDYFYINSIKSYEELKNKVEGLNNKFLRSFVIVDSEGKEYEHTIGPNYRVLLYWYH